MKDARSDYRCLTVRQPWAHQILTGEKVEEFRSWDTSYRGLLLIHAAKVPEPGEIIPASAALGAVIGAVRIAKTQWLARKDSYSWSLTDVVAFGRPIPCNGALNFWFLPLKLVAEVESQLPAATNTHNRGKRP